MNREFPENNNEVQNSAPEKQSYRTPLSKVYTRFRVQYYRDVFKRIQNRELSLTTVEAYSVELIYALGKPTINEFASYIGISSPNATYKVNSLIKKGYVRKVRSETDKREFYLEVTEKYYKYWNISEKYFDIVEDRIKAKLTPEEYEAFNRIVDKIAGELMPEVDLK